MNVALSGSQSGRKYYTLLDQSVRGLTPGSLVCYNGIAVGKVARVTNDFTVNKVCVEMLVTTPQIKIFDDLAAPEGKKTGTRIQLVTSFVTGLQYLDLSGGFVDYPELPEKSLIPSVDTNFDKIAKKVDKIAENLDMHLENFYGFLANLNKISQSVNENIVSENPQSVLSKIKKILDNLESLSGEANQRHMQEILQNLTHMSNAEQMGVTQLLQTIQQQIQEVSHTLQALLKDTNLVINSQGKQQDIALLVTQINQMLKDNHNQINRVVQNLDRLSTNLEQISANMKKDLGMLSKHTQNTVQSLNYFLQKDLQQIGKEIHSALQELGSVLRIIKAKPNALFWGSEVREQ
jgi:ABC-type transporter Mla subunit MlaD